jgi:dolichol-phosphate mannosyltransferase
VLCHRLKAALASITENYEIVLVFDCSPDDGWQRIEEACAADPRVKGLHLARNFGQHAAIVAGLQHDRGEWIVVMDCDLQEQPEEIPSLYAKAMEGFDVVQARRKERQDSWGKRHASAAFHRLFSYMTDIEVDPAVANFGIYHRRVIGAVLAMGDASHFFPMMVRWVGFRSTAIPVEHAQRSAGRSGYRLRPLLRLAEKTIVSFSDKPLRLTAKFGFAISVITLVVGAHYLLQYLRGAIEVSGYTSIILSMWFLGGALLFSVGMAGIYIGRVFDQVKGRPRYVISRTANLTDDRQVQRVDAAAERCDV